MSKMLLSGTVSIIALVLVSAGLIYAAPALTTPAFVLGMAGAAMPAAAGEYYCTTESFPNIRTDRNIGTVGRLNFGKGNFAGFDQADWINTDGSHLWPDCADGVAWMPAAGQMTPTSEPLTRIVTFNCRDCRLTEIIVAAHQNVDASGSETGVLTIRGLDKRGRQIGESVSTELNYIDGCVTIDTGFTQSHSAIEISYSRGSELGIVELSYCCGREALNAGGCAPAFWGQAKNIGDWEEYAPSQDFDAVFGVDLFSPNITLLQALRRNGGGVNRLARNGVAALLNASSSDVFYPYTADAVVALVQAGDANSLERANSLRCPLTRHDHDNDHGHGDKDSNDVDNRKH